MIVKHTVEKTIEVEETVGYICDRCGEMVHTIPTTKTQDIIQCRHEFGYGSKNDGMKISFDICEACFFEILKQGAVQYDMEDTLSYEPEIIDGG